MSERLIEVTFLSKFDGMANKYPSPVDKTRPDGRPSLAQKRFMKGEEYVYSGPVTVCEPAEKGAVRKLPESVVRTLRGAGLVEFRSAELALLAKHRAEKEAERAEKTAAALLRG